MSVYAVYAKELREDAVFVKEGFNWFAFAFTGFWAMFHGMWIYGILIFMVLLGIAPLAVALNFPLFMASLFQIGAILCLGFLAAPLRELFLLQKGNAKIGQVLADTSEEAEIRFFANLPVAAPQGPPAATDVLGLFDDRQFS